MTDLMPDSLKEYEPDHSKAVARCAKCRRTGGLWEAVAVSGEGWRPVEVIPGEQRIEGTGRVEEVTWVDGHDTEGTGSGGCAECGHEGRLNSIAEYYAPPKVGWDGEPIYKPLDGQLGLL